MATTQALAAAGGRAQYVTYVFRIPSGVLMKLQEVGMLRTIQTSDAGIEAVEYEFLAPGAAYVMKFLEMI